MCPLCAPSTQLFLCTKTLSSSHSLTEDSLGSQAPGVQSSRPACLPHHSEFSPQLGAPASALVSQMGKLRPLSSLTSSESPGCTPAGRWATVFTHTALPRWGQSADQRQQVTVVPFRAERHPEGHSLTFLGLSLTVCKVGTVMPPASQYRLILNTWTISGQRCVGVEGERRLFTDFLDRIYPNC